MESDWTQARDTLIAAITNLGFPAELGNAIAKHLGSPKAILRMTAYLHYTKPNRAEEIVDEMLAIRSEIDAWREKKASQHASGTINAMLRYGFEDQGEDR